MSDEVIEQDSPTRSAASDWYALVRRCNVCGNVNAVDLDASPEAELDMHELDHSVERLTREETIEARKGAGRCDLKALIESLRAQLAAHNRQITQFYGWVAQRQRHET